MTFLTRAALIAALAFAAAPALAQHAGHGDHASHSQAAAPAASPSTAAFEAANAKMHEGMAITYSGDPDVDFARGMIPHHQGAIDMAKVALAHGKDPQMRKLAQEIVDNQEKEIAVLKDWLAKNDKK
jgi:uncharacterized protein (DUF305 family)